MFVQQNGKHLLLVGSCIKRSATHPEFELAQVYGIVPGDSIATGVYVCGPEENGIAEELK